MKKYIIFLSITFLTLLTGCNQFLNINPKSEVTNDDMFTTAEGCEDALYGIYADMGTNRNLFGEKLSFMLPEMMSGNMTTTTVAEYKYLSYADWGQSSATTAITSLWDAMYANIGYINNVIENLENNENDYRYMNLYKGEAYALRAFMHFEVARYFAVAFASTDAAAKASALPYVTAYGYTPTPYSSLEDYFAKIIEDLVRAEQLLTADQELVPAVRDNAANGFTSCRIMHMNLYAVQALMARVYWTMGGEWMTLAGQYAEKVIDSEKFPLMLSSDLSNMEGGVLNLKETIFGLYSTTVPSRYYSLHAQDNASYTLNPNFLNIYEDSGPGEGSDLRQTVWFNSSSQICTKHLNPIYLTGNTSSTYTGSSIIGFSLISVPEMYYIVAEANLSSDPEKAMKYLDYVIASRGMVKFADRDGVSGITADDIYREREKEMFMDGQTWHNMKRLQKDRSIDSNELPGNDDDNYRLPIPIDSELTYRQ